MPSGPGSAPGPASGGHTHNARMRLIMELRGDGIADQRVLDAIERVPRERFVPHELLRHAYENRALPIGRGQTISQPAVVAFMTQLLELGPRMRVLEVGTGSGYQAAVLARLCTRVYSVERDLQLLLRAQRLFEELDIGNVTTRLGDGTGGWPQQAPFDRILVTAAADGAVPAGLFGQLRPDGVLVAPVGHPVRGQHIFRYSLDDRGDPVETRLWPVRFVPLVAGRVDRS